MAVLLKYWHAQQYIMKIAFVSPYPPSQVTLNEYGYHLIRSFIAKPGVDEIYVLTNHLKDNSQYSRYAAEGIEIILDCLFNSFINKPYKFIEGNIKYE